MLALVVQIITMIGVSSLAAWLIGSYYLLIGGLVAAFSYTWFIVRRSQRTELVLAEGPTPYIVNLVYRFVIALFLGMVWASLPIIFVYGGLKAADDRRQSP